MTNKLIQLALLLESEGMIEEARATFDLISLGNDTELSQWQAAWDSVSQPIPTQFPGRALKFMIDGIKDMAAAGEALQGVDPDDLDDAGKAIKSLSQDRALDADTLKKFSKIGTDPEITKEASGWLGMTRAIPYVGPLISGLFAAKNIYYGIQELGKTLSAAEELGVPWYTALKSENLNTLADRHAENPIEIITVDKLAKSVQVFWDEMISLFINVVDFVKDCAFAIAAAFTLGWSGWLDVALSFVFMGIEMVWESQALKPFKEVVAKIRQGVSDKFREVLQESYQSSEGEFAIRRFGPDPEPSLA